MVNWEQVDLDARGNRWVFMVMGHLKTGFDRVSGNSSRSADIGWCCCSDVIAGTAGYVGSGATRAVD